MQIDEAIEILQNDIDNTGAVTIEDFIEAEQLGVEALKRVKWHKVQHLTGYYELLPGESPR